MSKPTKALDIQKLLADDIVHGRRAPGGALDEVTLAREFGVSRTPVREALRQLEISGLVEARPHRGALVRDVPPETLDEMFSVMAELEALCARWSATLMTEGERRQLRDVHEGMATLVAAGRREDYVVANDRFHDLLYDGSHNAFLAETTRHVRLRLTPFRRVQFEGEGRLARSSEEHAHILDAIERGDVAAAEAAMRLHLGLVREALAAAEADRIGPGRRRPRTGLASRH